VIALGAGTAALALGFHAGAPWLRTLREPARLLQEGTFAAGMLLHTGLMARSHVAATVLVANLRSARERLAASRGAS
jgi:hypothetical protein